MATGIGAVLSTQEVWLNTRSRKQVLIWSIIMLLAACTRGGSPATGSLGASVPSNAQTGMLSVQDAIQWLGTLPTDSGPHSLVLDAQINQPPTQVNEIVAPPANCPIVAARLPTLTDQPFRTEFTVAGVQLPNLMPQDLPALALVIPYDLGIIDLPAHAELHGHVLDPGYASCPDAGNLFILDRVSQPGTQPPPVTTPSPSATLAWQEWTDALTGLGLRYPAGWSASTTHNVGSVVSAEFSAPDGAQRVSLVVTAGETYWTQSSGNQPPTPLDGQRRVLASAGPARARLVDLVGDDVGTGHRRTLRLVLNYAGNTVSLSTSFVDGAALDPHLLAIYSDMEASLTFTKPLGITDPMDPTLTAKTEIGQGPFIDEATAISRATTISSLSQTTLDSSEIVAERAAREKTPGVCREFAQRPEAIWLITLSGTKPTGEMVKRIVYLDASTGESICQTDLSTSRP